MRFNATLPEGLLPEGDVEGMRHFLSTLITPVVPQGMHYQVRFLLDTSTSSRRANTTLSRRCTLVLAQCRSWLS